MPKRSSTGRLDLNQLAKHIVDQATGDASEQSEPPRGKTVTVALGRIDSHKKTDRPKAVKNSKEGHKG